MDRILSDAAREQDGVNAVHGSDIGTDIFADLVEQHVCGEFGVLVALFSGGHVVPHIARRAGDTEQTAFLVEELGRLFRRPALALLQEGDGRGVDAAGTGAHDEAVERGQAHGRIDAFAVFDRRDGRTVAEVAGDDLRAFERDALDLGIAFHQVFVRCAVSAVLADLVFLRKVLRDRKTVGIFRHGAVEGVVENDDLGFLFAKDFRAGVDALDVCRVVQRGQR